MKLIQYAKSHPKTIITLLGIICSIYLMLIFKLDARAVTIIAIVLGYITNIFVSLTTMLGLIPIIGPLLVKLLTIPIFWIINGMGYFTSFYAMKKGYGRDLLSHRLITTALLIGIALGYILGHLVPVR
tara:strand:- start:322 stop:705 length:384 start_codon:yes stop_codon:yes gene_type:complete